MSGMLKAMFKAAKHDYVSIAFSTSFIKSSSELMSR